MQSRPQQIKPSVNVSQFVPPVNTFAKQMALARFSRATAVLNKPCSQAKAAAD
jgi:hypothetical protein